MDELRKILENVSDSYDGFVMGMVTYALYSETRYERLVNYITEHPEATSSDIIYYVSIQDDFYDDAVWDEEPATVA